MTLTNEILEGLLLPKKTISPKYFYNQAGSTLFDKICFLPEYYITRTEQFILENHLNEIADLFGPEVELLELGSGSSLKTRLLLNCIQGQGTYIPIDISEEFLFQEAQRLAREYPRLKISPLYQDFTQVIQIPRNKANSNRVVFFPGSTIGNFEPEEALTLLCNIRQLLDERGTLLIGIDLVKSPKTLEAAYNDSQGITSQFNLNLLTRINADCAADFQLENFKHHAFFNHLKSRIEMHLVSLRDQSVRVGPKLIHFDKGETIHTENSYKYTDEHFRRLLHQSGFSNAQLWTDAQELFAVYCASSPGLTTRHE